MIGQSRMRGRRIKQADAGANYLFVAETSSYPVKPVQYVIDSSV